MTHFHTRLTQGKPSCATHFLLFSLANFFLKLFTITYLNILVLSKVYLQTSRSVYNKLHACCQVIKTNFILFDKAPKEEKKDDKKKEKKKKGEPDVDMVSLPSEFKILATFKMDLAELVGGSFDIEETFTLDLVGSQEDHKNEESEISSQKQKVTRV